ncbi:MULTISPECIES: hypothetical protein [Providencia]|uniref:hypothetical protein n=1 Tax=Providencia TaxID=586 RepID=UPI002230A444|nr:MULTISPECIES: hypothetical protein [Providencia]MBZ3683761.1 hypothetical protein [Providencia rettgeri]MDM9285633.1 hypothetical protein [Providencia rettgeri]MDV5224728.1 hypothetical protein [Providencia rettgeri]
MKKIAISFLFVISILSIVACDGPKNTATPIDNINENATKNDRFSAPFGLRWGMSLNEIENNILGKVVIEDDQARCPLIKIKTASLKGGLKDIGEYELLILPKNQKLQFDGLIGIRYVSTSENKLNIDDLVNDLRDNLKRKYGEPTEVEVAKNGDDVSYMYDIDDYQIDFIATKSVNYNSILLNYVFYPKEHRETLESNIKSITEECLKQRNPL